MEILSKEPKNDVPEFVKKCTEIIEREKNIKSVGLYRVPGQVSRIQKIRIEINNSNWAVLEGSKIEAHDLTGNFFTQCWNFGFHSLTLNKLSERIF